jgi:hypothetical protein
VLGSSRTDAAGAVLYSCDDIIISFLEEVWGRCEM